MPGRLPAAEKVRRDAQIVRDRARGLTWATIAERHGVSVRQCQAILSGHLAAQRGCTHADAAELVDELLMQFDATLEEFALLAEETRNDAVRVAALKSKAALLTQRLTVLRICGLLPASGYQLRYEIDARRVQTTLMSALVRHDLSNEVVDDLLGALEGRQNGA